MRKLTVTEVLEFKKFDKDIYFPSKAIMISYRKNPKTGKFEKRQTTLCSLSDTKVNIDIPPKTFELEYPRGTLVYDEAVDIDYYVGDSNSNLVSKQPSSMVGKVLPELKDLKIELSQADVNNKMILICFFDLEQRPSRNCITELTKKANLLKEKGVEIIAVQISNADKEALNDQLKKLNLPFSVGQVNGNYEKIKATWGIRALPWLVLTDTERIIKAEGFSINDLDIQIDKMRK